MIKISEFTNLTDCELESRLTNVLSGQHIKDILVDTESPDIVKVVTDNFEVIGIRLPFYKLIDIEHSTYERPVTHAMLYGRFNSRRIVFYTHNTETVASIYYQYTSNNAIYVHTKMPDLK